MTAASQSSDDAHPRGWRDLVYEKIDFRAAFQALEGYRHFYSETLRGFVCLQQRRLGEALAYFTRADRLCAEAPCSPENERRQFLNRAFTADAAIASEALDRSKAAATVTDRALSRFVRADQPAEPAFDQMRISQIALYNLIRGQFQKALETYQFLIEDTSASMESQQVGFSIGAAAAAHELGLQALSEKYYENATLGVGVTSRPFQIAAFSSRLHALLTHWDRQEEAKDWLRRIDSLDCPPESHRLFKERADILLAASRARKRIFLH